MNQFNLPRLPRQPIRPDKEPGIDSEIWFPEWKCFCCHDTGLVASHLASMVISGFDKQRDKRPACHRCDAGATFTESEEYDQRFNRGICNELDQTERDNWLRTIKAKQQRILDLKRLSRQFGMSGVRDRMPVEEIQVRRRYQEICNANPEQTEEQLEKLERGYLDDEDVEQEIV